VQTEVGAPFDPTVHEAVLTQPSDEFEEGSIARVLEPGYLLHGRLLRAAKVIVVQ
jgi:molecular chaperone GrpE